MAVLSSASTLSDGFERHSKLVIPESLQALLLNRIDSLDLATRETLQKAAVIGLSFAESILVAISDDERELDQHLIALQRVDFIRESAWIPEREYTFRHPLIREATYGTVLRRRRRTFHLAVAEAMEIHFAENLDSYSAIIGHHYLEARDERAVGWLVQAAEQAQSVYDSQSAIKYATQALNLAEHISLALPVDALSIRGGAYEIVGDNELARNDYERQLAFSRETADRELEWKALITLGFAWAERDFQQSGDYIRQALDLARQMSDATTLAHSLNRMGNWYINLDRPFEALQVHDEALAIFKELDEKTGLAETHDLLGMANLIAGNLTAARDHSQSAIELFSELNNQRDLSSALSTMSVASGTILSVVGLPARGTNDEWLTAGQQSLAIAREIGNRPGEAFAFNCLSLTKSIRGYLADALVNAEQSLEIATEIQHLGWMTASNFAIAYCNFELLDIENARAYTERCQTLATELGSVFWVEQSKALRAAICTATRQFEQCREVLASEIVPDETNESLGQRTFAFRLAELEFTIGNYQRALELIDDLIEAAGRSETDQTVPHLAFHRGEILEGLGRIDEAFDEIRAARLAAFEFGFRPLLWRIDLALGRLQRARGDDSAAEQSFNDGWSTVKEITEALTDASQRSFFIEQAKGQFPERNDTS